MSLTVRESVEAELSRLPEELATSATAASALCLADSIDLGIAGFRFQAGLVAQLRECMSELAARAPAKPEGDHVDELNERRAARRRSAAAG